MYYFLVLALPLFVSGQITSCRVTTLPDINGVCPDPTTRLVTSGGCCPIASISTTAVTTAAPCVDKLNPSTGRSDCPNRTNLCTNSVYLSLMRDQCPRTCGFCTATAVTTATTCVDKLNPSTGRSDCPNRANLCTNSAYLALMRDQCPRTCRFCT